MMDFTKITLRFENCENIEIPKEYIKDLRWVLDENNKCTLFYVRFKKNMIYSKYWSIFPGLNEMINKDPDTGKLFKRLRYGDICHAWIDYEDGTCIDFEVPIEPDTDLFYKPNPWQVWNSKIKTLLIKRQEE